jgi:glycosyltransferase involved in cell wall biosynthesis
MNNNNEDDIIKVLICCQFFNGYTGSEMSNYEMSRELVRQGFDVSVISTQVGDPILSMAKKAGVKVYDINNPPREEFDIIHINHKPIGEMVLKLFPNTPAVMHVRSEVIPVFEEPIIHPQIKRYISIRESITEYIKGYGVSSEKIVEIDNPFDYRRFNTSYKKPNNKKKVVLFVGTLDHLRRNMLYHMREVTKRDGHELWIIGKNSGGYLGDLLAEDHVKTFGQQKNVENYIKKADYTVGIFRGRTTIEGWMCGKPAFIYEVDKQGTITSTKFVDVPEDVDKYRADNSIDKVIDLYWDVFDEIDNE